MRVSAGRATSAPTLPCAARLRRLAALFGILALLLQAWVPLVHRPAGQVSLAGFAGALCLAPGADRSAPADDQRGTDSHKAQPCPICLALQLGGLFLVPVLAAPILGAFVDTGRGPASAIPRLIQAAHSLAQPRGPPLAA